jgi:hypothetical protein
MAGCSVAPEVIEAIGPATTVQSRVQATTLEMPRDGEGQAVRQHPQAALRLFLSALILGLPLGWLLGIYLLRHWQRQQARQRDIDQLAAQFQELFRDR